MNHKYSSKLQLLTFITIYLPAACVSVWILTSAIDGVSTGSRIALIILTLIFEGIVNFIITNKLGRVFEADLQALKSLDSSLTDISILKNKIELMTQADDLYQNEIRNLKQQKANNLLEIDKIKQQIDELSQKDFNLTEEIELQDKLNKALMELTAQFILQVDSEGIITSINTALALRLGYVASELIGLSIGELFMTDQATFSSNKNSFSDPVLNTKQWMIKLVRSIDEPVAAYLKVKSNNPSACEYIRFTSNKLADGTLLCVGKSINDELAMQSNILRKNREFEYINQINESLISNWDIDALLVNIINRIEYLFDTRMGAIYVLDDLKKWQLRSARGKNLTEQEIKSLEIEKHFDHSIINETNIRSIEVNTEFYNYLILAPLEVENEVIAILVLALSKEMSPNDISILKMLKNQASMVIQRAIIYDQLRNQYFGTIEALVNVIEAKDKYTEGHSRRVSRFSVEIAKEMGYSNEEVENIEIAGLLHDIGKIGIDQNILAKRGKLTLEEYEVIKNHPVKGIQILEAISFDDKIKEGILYHHLRYDLKGYPKCDLTELPDYAAIIGLADAFDAMTSARSYSAAKSMSVALEEVIRNKSTQFEPIVVEVIERLIKESPEKIQDIINDVEIVQFE
ncbi:MAG: hypothetical protein BGO41_09460 [Clostridiales bacterium 38-18]|nr:MAG: hypothetical protein BGO41_09460 [Clostridiales bacterium 38-18]